MSLSFILAWWTTYFLKVGTVWKFVWEPHILPNKLSPKTQRLIPFSLAQKPKFTDHFPFLKYASNQVKACLNIKWSLQGIHYEHGPLFIHKIQLFLTAALEQCFEKSGLTWFLPEQNSLSKMQLGKATRWHYTKTHSCPKFISQHLTKLSLVYTKPMIHCIQCHLLMMRLNFGQIWTVYEK